MYTFIYFLFAKSIQKKDTQVAMSIPNTQISFSIFPTETNQIYLEKFLIPELGQDQDNPGTCYVRKKGSAAVNDGACHRMEEQD